MVMNFLNNELFLNKITIIYKIIYKIYKMN